MAGLQGYSVRRDTEGVSPSGVSSSRPLCSSKMADRAAAIALHSAQSRQTLSADLTTELHARMTLAWKARVMAASGCCDPPKTRCRDELLSRHAK